MHENFPYGMPLFNWTQLELDAAFPGGFTIRDEANALTAYAFRNGPIENLHAGKRSPLLDDPELSRITQAEMKEIMIVASAKLADALQTKKLYPEGYDRFVRGYGLDYCRNWQR
jgi:hypothetical protein